MYYYAKKDGSEFGVPYQELCRRVNIPEKDLPINTTEIEDWVAYLPKDAPSNLEWYQTARQVFPVDGVMTWEVVDLPDDEKARIEEEMRIYAPIAARKKRDRLLNTTVDIMNMIWWESLSDEKKQEWRIYRQALLDVPQQEGYPENIVWPNKPE